MKQNRHNRRIVFYKTGGICAYCGRELDPLGQWHIDHVTPKIEGGKDAIDNLLPACQSCNMKKRGRDPDGYRQALLSWMERGATGIEETATLIAPCNADASKQIIGHVEAIREIMAGMNLVFYFEESV